VKEKQFKYALGERVMIIGKQGLCVVTGRGLMEFCSGGSLNIYQVSGASADYVQENLLWSPSEAYAVCRKDMEGFSL